MPQALGGGRAWMRQKITLEFLDMFRSEPGPPW